jgi:type VI protein secretion system component VasK
VIEGQTLNFSATQTDSNDFIWPGPQPEEASIRVMYNQQEPYLQSFTGTWALFRLMQFATLIPTTNPQQYIMQVTAGTSTATYHLMTDNKANPFLAGVIDKFRLPEQL